MALFPRAHATHPQWPMAVALVVAQLKGQMATAGYAEMPSLGVLYVTDHCASYAQDILDELQAAIPTVTDWVGSVGVGILANNAEYWDEPAIAVMLMDIPQDEYRVFSGVTPLAGGFSPHTALVHADMHTEDVFGMVREFAGRTGAGQVFGGIASSRWDAFQIACSSRGHIAGHGASGNVFQGGLSGVAFGRDVNVISKVTQGCMPLSKVRTVTRADHNMVLTLDGRPALDVMLGDLNVPVAEYASALDLVRTTMVRLVSPEDQTVYANALGRSDMFADDATVRHVLGLDPERRGVTLAAVVPPETRLVFCRRSVQTVRTDLMRMCTELRDELELQDDSEPWGSSQSAPLREQVPRGLRRISGAIYISCTARGGGGLGSMGAEMQLVRKALGDVPLVGFYAGGEIAHNHIYSYSGVLTVFTSRDYV